MREIEFRVKIELKEEYRNGNEIERDVNKIGEEMKWELYKRVLELEEEREIKRYGEERGKELKKRAKKRVIMTTFGKVEIERKRLSDGERYIIPLDEILGMRGRNVTGCLREIVSYCASQMSYEATGRLVKKVCGVEICNREIELIVKEERERIRETGREEIKEFWERYPEEERAGVR